MTQQKLPVRLHTASGSSVAQDTIEAGTAAARQAMAGMHGHTPELIIVYTTVRYDLPALLGAIRAVTGDVPLVGETSAGHFAGAELIAPETGVVVLAMTAGPYRLGIASVQGLAADGETAGITLARQARATLEPDRSRY
jgi:hypothetical protein